MSQNLQKWVKCVRFLICVNFFLRFEKFHIENNTGYDFCVLNNLQFKSDHKKKRKLLVIQYSCSTFGCFLIKIHKSFERSAIEIDKRENIQDNFIHTLLIFTWKNSQELKLISNL